MKAGKRGACHGQVWEANFTYVCAICIQYARTRTEQESSTWGRESRAGAGTTHVTPLWSRPQALLRWGLLVAHVHSLLSFLATPITAALACYPTPPSLYFLHLKLRPLRYQLLTHRMRPLAGAAKPMQRAAVAAARRQCPELAPLDQEQGHAWPCDQDAGAGSAV